MIRVKDIPDLLKADVPLEFKRQELLDLRYQTIKMRDDNKAAILVLVDKADKKSLFEANKADYKLHSKELDQINEAIDLIDTRIAGTQLELDL